MLKAGKLFCVDYAKLIPNERKGSPTAWLPNPFCLLYWNAKQNGLLPFAILIKQPFVTGTDKLFVPPQRAGDDAAYWAWRYAKNCFLCADLLMHQFGARLAHSSFIEEIALVSARASFPVTHPIMAMLRKHMRKTFSENTIARQELIPNLVALFPFAVRFFLSPPCLFDRVFG